MRRRRRRDRPAAHVLTFGRYGKPRSAEMTWIKNRRFARQKRSLFFATVEGGAIMRPLMQRIMDGGQALAELEGSRGDAI